MDEGDREGNAPGSSDAGTGLPPAPREPADPRATEFATALACAMNVTALFAAPRVLARALAETGRLPSRDEIATTLEDCTKALGAGAGEMPPVAPLQALQVLLASWEPPAPASLAMVEAARAWLRLIGLPDPDEGWDRWDGAPTEPDEPEPAKVRPMPRVLRAEPMTIEEWARFDGPGDLVDGVLVEERATTPLRDAVIAWFLEALRAWASPRGAVVFGPGHKLVVSELGGRKPDICIYAADALPESVATLSSPPPMLVVEVSSPRKEDKWTDFVTKDREYARRGVRRFWRAEPTERFIECLEPGPGERYVRYLGVDSEKLLDTGLAGLALDLDDLWARLDLLIPGVRGETS